jgi:hypothetical protein
MNVDLVEQFNFIIVYMYVPPVVKHVHINKVTVQYTMNMLPITHVIYGKTPTYNELIHYIN